AASAQKTAFCWVDGKQAAASAQKTAFCWVEGQQAVGKIAAPSVKAGGARLNFERPSLATI
ncbi:hypothetical protein, partial [Massilia horti]|uniref:hypothetical protein n=1 Tax=Massilia horti TaxID=2562153 RepID=UPI001981EBD4